MAQYTITQLEVGSNPRMPAGVEGDPTYRTGEFIRSPFSMSLISGENLHILVDSGVNMEHPEVQQRLSPTHGCIGQSPKEVLKEINLTPEDIDAVILTHLHWDHAGGIKYYPNAKIYLQKAELFGWLEALSSPAVRTAFAGPIIPEDLHTVIDLLYQGKLILLDGEVEHLFPHIHIKVNSFAHSFAQSIVYIENTELGEVKHYAVVGDLCNRPENLLGTPNSPGFMPNTRFSVGGVVNMLKDYERLMDWVDGDVGHVIMTHDGTWQDTPQGIATSAGLFYRTICT